MRFLLILLGCQVPLLVMAQTVPQTVRVQVSYEKAGQYLTQAIEVIEAASTISAVSTVEYKAGSAVTLLPGFVAQSGSVFKATIGPVASMNEGITLQLKAFPNPFDQSTIIDYFLPAEGKVNLWIVDLQGKIIAELVKDEKQSAGRHQLEWKPDSIGSGIYIPILETNQQKVMSRLIKK